MRFSAKQRKMLIRIVLGAVLLVAAVLLPLEGIWRLLAFLAPYLIVGYAPLLKAGRNILHGQIFDENFLMALATIGALALGEYPEAVAVMLFYQVGELFENIAVGRSRASIRALMEIRPDTAAVKRNGIVTVVAPEEVEAGEVIVVSPGEKIPLDGVVLSGHSFADTSALTGESVPRELSEGSEALSGCINQSGVLEIKVSKPFGESTVAKILELVEHAASKKAKTENFITRFAKWYTPCVVIGAVLLAIVPPLFTGFHFAEWISRALTFLVISCPCALVISVPLGFFGGIGGASRCGILIKGSNHLEALSRVKTAVFDKTGTLTQGTFRVQEILPENGFTVDELLLLAAAAEQYSSHPIAQSLLASCKSPLPKAEEVNEEAGFGLSAKVNGRMVAAGNRRLMDRCGVSCFDPAEAGTIVHVAVDGTYAGCIRIADEMKPEAKASVAALRENGIRKTVMLTGDTEKIGEAVARELSIDEVHAELLPDGKVKALESVKAAAPEELLLYAGDGMNDAPVLAMADVGVAMGGLGSDAAIEAADVVIMDDNPKKIPAAMRIARRTMRIVRQNIVFALGIKAIMLVLGALGFANMWIAVFADVGVSVLAILNSMRALHTGNQVLSLKTDTNS